VGINFKATIKKGSPMPCICEICSSVKALPVADRDKVVPENNLCFKAEDWVRPYKPFTNSKRTVSLTCKGFSHMRSCTYR